jgi:hypothetical protein
MSRKMSPIKSVPLRFGHGHGSGSSSSIEMKELPPNSQNSTLLNHQDSRLSLSKKICIIVACLICSTMIIIGIVIEVRTLGRVWQLPFILWTTGLIIPSILIISVVDPKSRTYRFFVSLIIFTACGDVVTCFVPFFGVVTLPFIAFVGTAVVFVGLHLRDMAYELRDKSSSPKSNSDHFSPEQP